MRPMIWPLREFLLPVWWSSASVHPLGARKRSSLRIASAFANSSNPSISVQNPMISLCGTPKTENDHASKCETESTTSNFTLYKWSV